MKSASVPARSADTYDYVIVGAGSAGCILANCFTREPSATVLLLEAGGSDAGLRIQMPGAATSLWGDERVNWGYQSEPEPHCGGRRLPVPRGKLLGGSSAINGMFWVRGHPADYDRWAAAGASGWSYEDVLPHFRSIESDWRGEDSHHGGNGPIRTSRCRTDPRVGAPLRAAAQACGFPLSDDHNGAVPEGFGVPDLSVDGGRRASASRAFLRPALRRRGLKVARHALCQRVLLEQGRAVGVEYRQGGQLRTARARREVILCAGAINSPQLLMLSGIGPAAALHALGIATQVDLPGVGQNLQEHCGAGLDFACASPWAFDSQLRADRFVFSVVRWMLTGTGPVASLPIAANAFIRTRPELISPDIQTIVMTATPMSRIWFPGLRAPMGHVVSVRNVLLHPQSRGSVVLSSPQAEAKPSIRFNFLDEPGDLATLRRSIRMLREVFARPELQPLRAREVRPGPSVQSDEALDAHVRQSLGTFCHPAGTCAMGRSGPAVVDERLRVRGVERLRVIDASVMPSLPGGNINAPTMMIAAKGAAMVLADH